jgi:hypothetical protein
MGEKLKQARLHLGFSEKEASIETKIPVSVLAAFEADDFLHMGVFVYASGFLKRYCVFLGLDASLFLDELRAHTAGGAKKSPVSRGNFPQFFALRLRSPAFIGILVGLMVFVGYFGINLGLSYSSPSISFFAGGGDFETTDRAFTFRGKTNSEADLTMNGRIVYLNESGEFEERVVLANGLNAFEFAAKNKFGKVKKIIRYIIMKSHE